MKLYRGDCLEVLKQLEEATVDSLITDPPAGISFMGKEWDTSNNFIPAMTEIFKEALRVLKPGAHGLVWALPRTSHWTATAVEQAGFEIRDVVTHLFGSGFPKSHDISKGIDKAAGAEREVIGQKANMITAASTDEAKQWQGWGTALKPASEHWILIRKPIAEKTIAANVLKWGCGGINIDECRITVNENDSNHRKPSVGHNSIGSIFQGTGKRDCENLNMAGRFPANLVLDEEAAEMLDEQSEGGASRFFYVAKASKKDRNDGLEGMPIRQTTGGGGLTSCGDKFGSIKAPAENFHPTVKSTKLMEYLIKLITPPKGVVLDPFMGSGSTGVAAKRLGFEFIGIEKNHEYFEIAEKRINS